MSKLLDQINKENDIKNIQIDNYNQLAVEIRRFLVENVSKTGGHLASNLGAVELTMALHNVLDFPEDKLIWDVGHQSYVHKILTGRKNNFDTLRQFEGLAGFPKRNESDCDSFDTGHSSTSISAALGMAYGDMLNGKESKIVAVIGDGALTGGMALEALNNVGALKRNLVIILNDNKMSISKNVGGMSEYLNKLRVGKRYNELKLDVESTLNKIPKVGTKIAKRMKRTKDGLKNLFVNSGFFDDLGITYIGPVNGHDINSMIDILNAAFEIDHPILIHVQTIKGKGYKYAEKNPMKFHGIGPFDMKTGQVSCNNDKTVLTYTDVFSKTLVKLAKTNEKIVAITAAMPDGTGLQKFHENYPDRFFDVGIAEEHGVTFAAGLATMGYKPFISIYSSFYQRAYDQILHDVCLQKLPVTLIIDRAGLVGNDGETHQGIFDISFLSAIPNITIIAPKNIKELIATMKYAVGFDGPLAIRFSRGVAYAGPNENNSEIEFGKSEVLNEGKDICVIAVGNMVEEANIAIEKLNSEGITPTFINARFLKPIDSNLIIDICKNHKDIIIVEEGIKKGGYGETVANFVQENELNTRVHTMAINDTFVQQGDIKTLRKFLKISNENIYEKVTGLLK